MHGAPMSAEKMTGRAKDMVPMSESFVPGPNHVICAKGKQAKQHPANRFLRSLVKAHLQEYSECPSKLERSFIVSKILKTIQQDGKGGFVRNIKGTWHDIGSRNSKEKIGQCFRDSLHTQYRSSTKAKANYRKRSQHSSSDSVSSNVSKTSRTASPNQSEKSSAYEFPISEVSFDKSAPQPDLNKSSEFDVDWRDLEPLPISDAVVFPANYEMSPSTTSSAASSYSAQDLYSQLSCSVLSSTTAASMATSRFGSYLQQSTSIPNTSRRGSGNEQTALKQQHTLLANFRAQARAVLPTPNAAKSSMQNLNNNNSNAFQADTVSSSGPAVMQQQDQYVMSSLQPPSVFPGNNMPLATSLGLVPPFVGMNVQQQQMQQQQQLQQQQQQLQLQQQQLQQQQQQLQQLQNHHLQRQQQQQNDVNQTGVDDQTMQDYLKWKQQFE